MVQRAIEQDAAVLAGLALLLWNDHDAAELRNAFSEMLKSEGAACFLAYEAGVPAGFAQCQLRHDYVEGAQTSPVGYLEGIFVLPEFRRQGLAGELLAACEDWAREQGCKEFASDCELGNNASLNWVLPRSTESSVLRKCSRIGGRNERNCFSDWTDSHRPVR